MPTRRWAEVFDDWLVGKTSLAEWLFRSLERPDNFPAYLTALFTLVLAVFAIVAWREATRSTHVLQGQLDELRDEQRAWVYAVTATFGADAMTVDADEVSADILVRLKNVGKKPARVRITGRLYYTAVPRMMPINLYWRRCEKFANPSASSRGDMIFPDQEKDVFLWGDIDKENWNYPTKDKQHSIFFVAGCVGYTFQEEKTLSHTTNFIFFIHDKAGSEFYTDKPYPTEPIATKEASFYSGSLPQAAD